MKALREFFVVLLCMILVPLVTSFGILSSFREIFQSTIMQESIKDIVTIKDDSPEMKEINDAIDKVTTYKGTDEIINSVIEDISNSNGDTIELSDKTYDLLQKALEENKDEFIKLGASEQDINEAIEEIKKPENRQKMTKELNDGFNESGSKLSADDVKALKTITSVFSPKTKKTMIIAMVVIVCLIALLTFSPYKWIRPVSICAIISGANLLVCYYSFDYVSKMLVSDGVKFNIDASTLSNMGYTLLVGGISGVIIYVVINILAKKNKIDVGDTPAPVVTEEKPATPAPAFKSTKYCASCGQPVNIDDTVCPTCGAPLE